MPLVFFYTPPRPPPWKDKKTSGFMGYRKRPAAWNGLKITTKHQVNVLNVGLNVFKVKNKYTKFKLRHFEKVRRAITWRSFFHNITPVWSIKLIDAVGNISPFRNLLASYLFCLTSFNVSWEMHFMDVYNRWVQKIIFSTISTWEQFVSENF